ncbi:hypothetical protein [Streptacidiphilus melanogenes]|uniref:hypothetical protein n=1 Tax=Streptacidiphilus melanogenes TaxID=411235 RepID=UPI0005A92754|nr:hypothetical protein [Streptacidiphilus melanogenes]
MTDHVQVLIYWKFATREEGEVAAQVIDRELGQMAGAVAVVTSVESTSMGHEELVQQVITVLEVANTVYGTGELIKHLRGKVTALKEHLHGAREVSIDAPDPGNAPGEADESDEAGTSASQ